MPGTPARGPRARPISRSRSSPTPLRGQSRVARQRLVYQALAEELATRVHALALTTLTPQEDES